MGVFLTGVVLSMQNHQQLPFQPSFCRKQSVSFLLYRSQSFRLASLSTKNCCPRILDRFIISIINNSKRQINYIINTRKIWSHWIWITRIRTEEIFNTVCLKNQLCALYRSFFDTYLTIFIYSLEYFNGEYISVINFLGLVTRTSDKNSRQFKC